MCAHTYIYFKKFFYYEILLNNCIFQVVNDTYNIDNKHIN